MDSTDFLLELEKARVVLMHSADFVALRGRGHELVNGAALTCASDVPWQMQVKCARCHDVFWFDNLAWRNGGADSWRLSEESRRNSVAGCAAARAIAGKFLAASDSRISLHFVRG